DKALKMYEMLINNTTDEICKNLKMNKNEIDKEIKEFTNSFNGATYYDNNINLLSPIKVQWKITNNCNLRCKHCYLGNIKNEELKFEQLLEVANKICTSNVFEVTLSGGEAILVKGIEKIIEIFLQNNISVNIFTNAIKLEEFINKLEKNKSNIKHKDNIKFLVSIDGTEAEHENIRGKGTYKTVIKAIKYAVKKGYSVTTNTVANKYNYESIDKLYLILNKLKVENIQISNLIVKGTANSKMKLTIEEEQILEKKLKKVVQKVGKSQLYYSSDGKDTISLLNKKTDEIIGKDNWKCCAGLGKATINYDGNVYCCAFIESSKIGNILELNLEEIWKNKKRYEFLNYILKNNSGRTCIVKKEECLE
ncbi:MAG: radical SAM protein, partial [Clostridia bacterium]